MWSPRPAPIPSQMYQIALERVTISKLQVLSFSSLLTLALKPLSRVRNVHDLL